MPQRRNRRAALKAVRTLIEYLGDDPDREGLTGTPDRVLRAWEDDWGSAYDQGWVGKTMASVKKGIFRLEGTSNMVIVDAISFVSTCEHHLALFHGTVDIAYIPTTHLLGLSKFARITELVTRRLQVQERITEQIADLIVEVADAEDVGVVVRAAHMCMASRGVRQPDSKTTTSAMRGEFMKSSATRNEFLRFIK